MGQGTITLPSGDRLVTQVVTFPGGATVHREEMVIAGTINQQIAAVVNSTPASTDYGLTVRPIQIINDVVHAMNAALNNIAAVGGQLDDTGTTDATENNVAAARITTKRAFHVNLRNDGGTEIGTSGNPVRTDPTGSTTQPISFVGQQPVHGTVVISSMPAVQVSSGSVAYITNPAVSVVGTVSVSSVPPITFSGAQPISTVAGTVAVTFPSAQSVNIANSPAVTFSGQQPIHGTVQVSNTVNTNVTNTPSITFSGQQPVHGTVVVSSMPAIQVSAGSVSYITNPAVSVVGTVTVSSLPPITFSGAQPISTVAGTVAVTFPSAQSVNVANTPAITFSGQQPVHGTVQVSSLPPITFASAQPISTIAGTVQVAFTPSSVQSVTMTSAAAGGSVLALYSEQQTQSTRLSAIETAVLGTPAVKFASAQSVNVANTPAITFSGQQPIHGTVVVSSIPPITFASPQTVTISVPIDIGAVAGTVQVAFTPSSTQAVTITSAAAGGTVLARYDEQQTQSTRLSAIEAAVLGTPAVKFASAQSVNVANTPAITFSGQQPIHGTVQVSNTVNANITNTPAITFSGQQPVHGTVRISGTSNVSVVSTAPITFDGTQPVSIIGSPSVTFSGQQPVHGTVVVSSIPAVTVTNITNPVNIGAVAGTVNVAFTPAAVQSVNLRNAGGIEIGTSGTPVFTSATITSAPAITFNGQQPVHGTVQVTNTVTTSVSNTPSITFSGQQPVHGTVVVIGNPSVTVSNTPSVSFASAQPISTLAGTVAVNVRNNIFTHKSARIDAHGAGNHTVVAGQANKRIKVYGVNAQAGFAGTVFMTWMDGTLPMAGTQVYIDREGHVESVTPPSFLFAPQPGTALVLHVGTIVNSGGGFRGRVSYFDDDSF